MMISCPPLSTSPPSPLVHPVISLVMWEWWSRDNGMLSFHMRQEDSLQASTCFSTGERNASCYLHIAVSQQLSILYFLFIISSIFWFSLVPGQRLTELSQASLSVTAETCLESRGGGGGAVRLQTRANSSICHRRHALRSNLKEGKAAEFDINK